METLFDAAERQTFRVVQAVSPKIETIVSGHRGCVHEEGTWHADGEYRCARCSLRVRVTLEFGPMGVGELADPDAKQLGPFVRDSETSRQAALANYPRQGSQRRRILEAFATGKGRTHGFTREELASWTELPDNSIRPRVGELIAGGWIGQGTKDGVPATRSTRLGNESEVLMLTATAVERLQRAEG